MFYLATTSLIAVWCTLEVASHKPFYSHHPDFVPNAQLINGIDDGLNANNNGNQQEEKAYELLVSTKDHIRCEKCIDGEVQGRMYLKDKGMIVKYQASKVDDDHQHVLPQGQGVVERPSAILDGPPVYLGQNQPAFGNWASGVTVQPNQRLTQPPAFSYQPQHTQQALTLPPTQRANYVMHSDQQSVSRGNPSLTPQFANYVMAQTSHPFNQLTSPSNQFANYAMQPGAGSPQGLENQASPFNGPQQSLPISVLPSTPNQEQIRSTLQQLTQPSQLPPQRQVAADSPSELMTSLFQLAVNSQTSPVGAGDAGYKNDRYTLMNDQQRKAGHFIAMVPSIPSAGNENRNLQGALARFTLADSNDRRNGAAQGSPASDGNVNLLGGLARYILGHSNDISNAPRNAAPNYVLPMVSGDSNGNQLGGSARFTLFNSNDGSSRNYLNSAQQPATLLSHQPLKLRPDGAYEYGFSTNSQSKQEIRDSNGNVMGRYSFITPEGNLHAVRYTAGEGGFRPVIQSSDPVTLSSGNRILEDKSDQLALPSVNSVQAQAPRFNGYRAMPIIVMSNPQPSAKATESSTAAKAKEDESERKEMMDELAKSIAKYVKDNDDEDESAVGSASAITAQSPAPLK